ncbi:MAG: hypothetical protein GY738_09150 [Pseudoalteromonas sp.]|nr:hypothetical protein [Pseudoalteromonas sp.]
MEEGFSNLQNIIFSISLYLVGASFVGFIFIPFCLAKIGIPKNQRTVISKFSTLTLFVIVFLSQRGLLF